MTELLGGEKTLSSGTAGVASAASFSGAPLLPEANGWGSWAPPVSDGAVFDYASKAVMVWVQPTAQELPGPAVLVGTTVDSQSVGDVEAGDGFNRRVVPPTNRSRTDQIILD